MVTPHTSEKHRKCRYKRRCFPNPILELFQIGNIILKHKNSKKNRKSKNPKIQKSKNLKMPKSKNPKFITSKLNLAVFLGFLDF